jgi:dUTP pyrophosphatase
MRVKLVFLNDDAKLLSQREGDVGFDLAASMHVTISHGQVGVVPTGIKIAGYEDNKQAPFTVFPKIEGRSGLASKGIFPVGGIIDPSYRGEIKVLLANFSSGPLCLVPGARCAQLVFYSCCAVPNITFERVDDVEATERGDAGFGSTGSV